MQTQATYSEPAFKRGSTKRLAPAQSSEEYELLIQQTSAGRAVLPADSNGWRFLINTGTSSRDKSLMDPMLASRVLMVIRGEDHHRQVIAKNVAPSVDVTWFTRVIETTPDRLNSIDLVPVIEGMAELLEANYFDKIDCLLKYCTIQGLAPEMLVTMLRTTFPLRGCKLQNWFTLLKWTRAELVRRNLDSKKILRGLV